MVLRERFAEELMRRTLRLLDRIWNRILRFLHADLCAVCAHNQITHNYDPALDAYYCTRCRMGQHLHSFEKLKGQTR